MCGRYALPIQPDALPEWFARQKITVDRVENADKKTQHEYNIAPSSYVPVFMKARDDDGDYKNHGDGNNEKEEHGIVEYMRWGFVPVWINTSEELKKNRYSTFNAKLENLESNRIWKGNLSSRCVIPVTGYYEWSQDGKKLPYYIKRKDDELMFIAGLYNHRTIDDEEMGSFTIITHKAPTWLKWLHQRMPVVLNPKDEAFKLWLDGKDLDLNRILTVEGNKDLIEWYRVDSAVGNSRNDNKQYILPLKEPLAGLKRKRKAVKEEENDENDENRKKDKKENSRKQKKQKTK